MAPERVSEKQIHYLRGLLKARGVRDGDSRPLIDAVYPQGLTKSQASAEIEKIKYMNGLPALWIHAYVRELRHRHEMSVDLIVEHLEVAFDGATKPAGLSRLQQQELIEWICNRDRPSKSEPSPEGRREAAKWGVEERPAMT